VGSVVGFGENVAGYLGISGMMGTQGKLGMWEIVDKLG
jgi:hypothetical protein